MVPAVDAHLVIDWTQVHFYNTVMGLIAGAALLGLSGIATSLLSAQRINPVGWSLALLVTGLVLFSTGLHMTLTWPLAPMGSPDNIAFGEPTLVLGAVCLALALYFWKRAPEIVADAHPLGLVCADLRHLKWILVGVGLALIAIAGAAVTWHLFTAPPEEPIAGLEAILGIPYTSTYAIAALWAVIGVIAIATPFSLDRLAAADAEPTALDRVGIRTLWVAGLAVMLMSAIVYFTHMGMVLNTAA